MIVNNFKEAIEHLLNQGLSKYKIAKELGYVSSTSINNLLANKTSKPSDWAIANLQRKFGITVKGIDYEYLR